MKILSIGKELVYNGLDIVSTTMGSLTQIEDINKYEYIVINGGDGSIRRALQYLHTLPITPRYILNPTGSFNVVAKIHRVTPIESILKRLVNNESIQTEEHQINKLNDEIFLFSAGNMGDLQHIFISETLRFGILKKGMLKYILAVLFLFPIHLIMTPFMLLSPNRFFIFTPLFFIKKFGNFYGKVPNITIDLENDYNLIELDGDLVTIYNQHLEIKPVKKISIVVR
jgi:hypothetical protein